MFVNSPWGNIALMFFWVSFFLLFSDCALFAADMEVLNAEVASDTFSKTSLSDWRQVVNGEIFPELKRFAPHAILKIQPSRLQARLLAQTYFKNKNKEKETEKDTHDFLFAILNELVKTNLVTVMDDWQKEVTSLEYSYDERLGLNFLSHREGALRGLYKESTLVKAGTCEFNKKSLKLELRKKTGEADKDYFWVASGFHIYFTGISVDGSSPDNVPACETMSFFKLSNTNTGVFWEKSGGGHLLVFEGRYFRPINYLKLKDHEEFLKITKKIGNRTCIVASNLSSQTELKKNWLCPN